MTSQKSAAKAMARNNGARRRRRPGGCDMALVRLILFRAPIALNKVKEQEGKLGQRLQTCFYNGLHCPDAPTSDVWLLKIAEGKTPPAAPARRDISPHDIRHPCKRSLVAD